MIGTWLGLAYGNGFGMPPDYSLRTGLLNYPTMMVKSGWMGQGQVLASEDVIEITPDGPVFRASVPTLDDTTGAAYEELRPCVLEGTIKPSRSGADSFLVDYKFTSEIKGTDRLVTYTLDPASGEYVPDFKYEQEICATLMFDAREGDGN